MDVNKSNIIDKFLKWMEKPKMVASFILGAMMSAIICYIVGYAIDGVMDVKPNITNINDELRSIKSTLKVINDSLRYYEASTNRLIQNTIHYSEDGLECYVGVNNELFDGVVSMDEISSNGLEEHDRIQIIRQNDYGHNKQSIYVNVHIVPNSPNSNAQFFINKNMMKQLGINPKSNVGVYRMFYKQLKPKSK